MVRSVIYGALSRELKMFVKDIPSDGERHRRSKPSQEPSKPLALVSPQYD